MLRLFVVLFVSVLLYYGCSENNNINSAPEITYMGMNKDVLVQGNLGLEDTLVVQFSFTDLDGDLSGVANNVQVTAQGFESLLVIQNALQIFVVRSCCND